ncbi:hypothetical protein B0J14DRAFT_561588 [Halenospora varia]|nr:hypothetical protein B0J14DRAFT_561588 [Halenospora varia]
MRTSILLSLMAATLATADRLQQFSEASASASVTASAVETSTLACIKYTSTTALAEADATAISIMIKGRQIESTVAAASTAVPEFITYCEEYAEETAAASSIIVVSTTFEIPVMDTFAAVSSTPIFETAIASEAAVAVTTTLISEPVTVIERRQAESSTSAALATPTPCPHNITTNDTTTDITKRTLPIPLPIDIPRADSLNEIATLFLKSFGAALSTFQQATSSGVSFVDAIKAFNDAVRVASNIAEQQFYLLPSTIPASEVAAVKSTLLTFTKQISDTLSGASSLPPIPLPGLGGSGLQSVGLQGVLSVIKGLLGMLLGSLGGLPGLGRVEGLTGAVPGLGGLVPGLGN